ncbi:MAG: hypothetical protein GTO41_25370 [Burkholderiales bacterium]|nr:hypothetical protein [Burkholderiales bacterium]
MARCDVQLGSVNSGRHAGPFWVSWSENLGDAIFFSLALGVLAFTFFNSVPGLAAIKAGIVPGACGLCVGKLVGGVWKEIAA